MFPLVLLLTTGARCRLYMNGVMSHSPPLLAGVQGEFARTSCVRPNSTKLLYLIPTTKPREGAPEFELCRNHVCLFDFRLTFLLMIIGFNSDSSDIRTQHLRSKTLQSSHVRLDTMKGSQNMSYKEIPSVTFNLVLKKIFRL